MNPEDFWRPFETTISSFSEVNDLIQGIFQQWSMGGGIFAWRGQVDASWALHSSLYRRLLWTDNGIPTEKKLYVEEGEILKLAHQWGLHRGSAGRLSILSQLAVMQHHGVPTRLIDVSFNPFIGLWFAVEKKWSNGSVTHEDKDARLFAIDVSSRLINETDEREWEDDNKRPWNSRLNRQMWCTNTRAWRPPRIESRISAQNGGFLLGGVPMSRNEHGQVNWRKNTTTTGGFWRISEVREATSLPLRVHKIEPRAGGVWENAVYTIRIAANAKAEIREKLEQLFGYRHSTIYPDFVGFASFGRPRLKSWP